MDSEYYGSGSAVPWISLGDTFQHKDTAIRIIVILTCCLSVLGSLCIIFSFVFFKQLRSKPREILLHISLMDFGVSISNLIGASVYFDQYYHLPRGNSSLYPPPDSLVPAKPVDLHKSGEVDTFTSNGDDFTVSETINGLCIIQAFFAGYFTISSVLWTIFLSVYIYLFLLYHATKPRLPYYSVFVSYLVSYGVPLIVALWLALTHRLGYAPYNSSGWCSLIVQDPVTGETDTYAVVLGNDLWIYLALFLIPILYLASRSSIHKNPMNSNSGLKKLYRSLEYKFLFIPVIFLALRVWTCILIILYTYIALSEKNVPAAINDTLLYLAGIGDSGQGFANGILFILFSRKVRNRLWRFLLCKKHIVGYLETTNSPETIEGQSSSQAGQSSSPEYGASEDTFVCKSIDNTSLLVEFDGSSRMI